LIVVAHSDIFTAHSLFFKRAINMNQATALAHQELTDIQAETPTPIPALTVERGLLLKALGHVQAVVEKRNTIPILSNVKLDVAGGVLALTATDMEIAVTEKIPADIQTEGSVTVPAHTLYDIVRKLPDGTQIHFQESKKENGRLSVKGGNSKFLLPFLSADDFPVIDQGEMTHHFTISTAELLALANKTRFAVSTDETRYYLNGIFIHAIEGTLTAVSTDGHRLAKMSVTLPNGAENIPGVIIPRKTAIELVKLVESLEEAVEVSLSKTKVAFVCGDALLISKLVEGTYPEYQNVIPERSNNIMEVEVQRLVSAVDRIATMSSEKTRAIRLTVGEGRLELSAANENSGSGQEVIDVVYTGSAVEAGFNSRYILEILSSIESDMVQFIFSERGEATLVFDPANQGALYVIMPMRI
jgi:DNA polymerase III subunit beta